jgi:hypothetical protein
MRKLLMASAAILGGTSTLALAQAPVAGATQGQYAGPYGAGPAANNNNNAWGIANTPTGSAAAGGLSRSIYSPNVNAVPAPGTVVIRLNGRVEVDMGLTASSAMTSSVSGAGYYKNNALSIGTYARIYPGFDGVAANGLRYGAAIEVRQNFGAADRNFIGAQTTGGAANSPSSNSSGQTLFVRRAFTYLASDNVGLVRFGQADGVLGLFDNCIFTTQCWDAGLGNFNGGVNQDLGPGGPLAIPFVWLDQAGAEYDTNKIVYLSPQYYGFDFGVDFAPSMGNGYQESGNSVSCNQAGPQCIGVTSGNDPTRWYNKVAVGLRWQQSFGAVDVKTYGYYSTASKENNTTLASVGGTSVATGAKLTYDNLSFYKFGAAVTVANTTFAADYIGGAINNQLAMRPTGAPNTNAVVTGVTYANGPITLGAETGIIDYQGSPNLVGISQRHEFEVAFGGSYKLAPGVQLAGEYMYMQRHQGNFNFNTGVTGAGTGDSHGQSLVFATVLTW